MYTHVYAVYPAMEASVSGVLQDRVVFLLVGNITSPPYPLSDFLFHRTKNFASAKRPFVCGTVEPEVGRLKKSQNESL